MSTNVVRMARPSFGAPDAERTILGAALLNPEPVLFEGRRLQPEHFTRSGHEHLWRLLLRMQDADEPIELVAVAGHVQKDSDAYGGLAYVAALADDVVSTDVAFYVRRVVDLAARREVWERMERAQDMLVAGESIETALGSIEDNEDDWGDEGAVKCSDIAFDAHQKLTRTIEARRKGSTVTVPMPFKALRDVLEFPIGVGAALCIAARPGMGKTALMLEVARSCASSTVTFPDGSTRLGRCYAVEMEMDKDQLLFRMACQRARLDSLKIRRGHGTDREMKELQDAYEYVHGLNLWIDDRPKQTVGSIRRAVRRNIQRFGALDILLVDYLGLMDIVPKNGDRKDQAIGDAVRQLRQEARKHGFLLVMLSQLNRGVENRADRRPGLADLRDSGNIEEHIDAALFIYRDEYYNEEMTTRPGEADLIIPKNRHGKRGTVAVGFDGPATRFHSLEGRS